jgi:hypothetical protein
MKFKLAIYIAFLCCVTVAAQGIFGTTESFSQTEFCKKYACDLKDRDDSFAATGTRYEYSIKLNSTTIKELAPKVVILRDVDVIREAKLILATSEARFFSNNAQAFSDFIKSVLKISFSVKEVATACRTDNFSEYSFNYRTLKKTGTFNIYCVLSESGGRLKISRDGPPVVAWNKNLLKTPSGFFSSSARMITLDDEMDTFMVSKSKESSGFDYLVDIIPLDFIKADFYVAQSIRQVREATANPYKEPIGSYVKKSEAGPDERIIDSPAHDGYAIFLQNKFKSFQTKTLKGVRYLEVGGQDWVTPTRDVYRYHFAGLTRDGKYFVHFVNTLETKILPKEEDPALDPNLPNAGERIYKAFEIAAKRVDQAKPSDFEPNLDKLDQFVNTLSVTAGQ